MPSIEDHARTAVEELLQSEENQLYEEIAIRNRAILEDPTVAGQFQPSVTYDAKLMGPMDDLRAFGRKYYQKVSNEAYGLVCGSGQQDSAERKKLLDAFGVGKTEVAAALAALLVAKLAIAPAIAVVLAALIVRIVFKPAHEAMCEVWATKL